ncbi:putative cytosolic oligopeptidase A [Diplonema papillatum]|nr:putative cytosolic oligopeptidase A [Diplonema papillatum]
MFAFSKRLVVPRAFAHTQRRAVMLLENPRDDYIPRYGAVKVDEVKGDVEKMIEGIEGLLTKVESVTKDTATWETVMDPLDAMDLIRDCVWGPIKHLMNVKDSEALRAVHDEMQPHVVRLNLKIAQSKEILEGLKALKASTQWDSFSNAQKRAIDLNIRGIRLSGVELEGDEKKRFNEIAEELSKLSTTFKNNVLDATKEMRLLVEDKKDVEGIPQHIKDAARQAYEKSKYVDDADKTKGDAEVGPWIFDSALFVPFMQHCSNRELREKMYFLYLSRATSGESDNTPVIKRVLQLRKEKARLLGFDSFADLSLASKMAPGVKGVMDTNEQIRAACLEKAKEEVSWMKLLAGHDLRPWDTAYYTQRIKEKALNLSPEIVEYFPLEHVITQVFSVVENLFSIRLEQVDIPDEISWDPVVRMFEVKDASTGDLRGRLLVDAIVRPESKNSGAWMSGIMTKTRTSDGKQVLPSVNLVLNAPRAVGDKPSLLTTDDVVTMFHELGHSLQQLLTDIDCSQVSGISGVEWDAIELPSQFMENWFFEKKTLQHLGKHYKTGEPLDEDTIENLQSTKSFMAAAMTLRQLEFGAIDLLLHSQFNPETEDPLAFERKIKSEYSALIIEPARASNLCSFSHIFAGGYAAGYYSYMWADVLQADAFAAFEEAGLDNEEAVKATGARFRQTVLGLGGSEHPMDVFKQFRGRPPAPDALLRHLGLADHPRKDLAPLLADSAPRL